MGKLFTTRNACSFLALLVHPGLPICRSQMVRVSSGTPRVRVSGTTVRGDSRPRVLESRMVPKSVMHADGSCARSRARVGDVAASSRAYAYSSNTLIDSERDV